MKRPPRLRRHLIAIVLVKMAFLSAFGLWLHGRGTVRIDADAVAAHVAGGNDKGELHP